MLKWLGLSVLTLLLVGCGSSGYIPVHDRNASPQTRSSTPRTVTKRPPKATYTPEFYTVRKGDTLYSIAWRYNLDFRTLAKRNNIGRGYNIYVGQRLRLKVAKKSTAKQVATVRSKPVKTKSAATKKAVAKAADRSKSSSSISSKSNANSSVKENISTPSKKKSAKVGSVSWSWPAKGRVINGYSIRGKVNKGINIAGRLGDPVFAAADGRVVYSGNGILGYGNLIIINHNGLYMSAYAHNSRIFVKEKARVRRGDKIAEVGRSGTDRHMLHFEIRRDGKPVNPSRYLPKRR